MLQRSKAILHIFEVSLVRLLCCSRLILLHLFKVTMDLLSHFKLLVYTVSTRCIYVCTSLQKYFYTCQNISDLFYSIHFNTISRFGYFSYIRSPQYISNTPSNYPASATVGKPKSIISTPSKNISATATLKSYSEPLISNNNNNS